MKLLVHLLAAASIMHGISAHAEVAVHSQGWADSVLAVLRETVGREPLSTISTTDLLLDAFSARHDRCAIAEVDGIRSTSFADLGALDSAMACAHRALVNFKPGCDSLVLIRGQVAMSYLYLKLEEFGRVDSICIRALALWNPNWQPTVLRNALLTNMAIAQAREGNLDGAEAGFRAILSLARAENAQQDIYDAMLNLGAMKDYQGQLDSAEHFFRESLANAINSRKVGRMARSYTNLASIATERHEHAKANKLLLSALSYADSARDLALQASLHGFLAENYKQLGDFEQAFHESILRFDLKDSLLNQEKLRTLAEMQAKFETVWQDKEINELRAEKLSAELDKTKVTRTRNVFLFITMAVLGIALALVGRLRYINKMSKAMKREKAVSEELLHNILPEEVADEIRHHGHAAVHEYKSATILFTDFRNFTELTGKMEAAELVGDLDHCFKAFDGIVEAHGVEKIKTIGDAYMAAGGLPDVLKGDPLQTVLAALDMQDFMRAYKQRRASAGHLYFEMRAGLHTGTVIAGIVGLKKYAYDIWGDTVNVANRMETNGEVGRVNISQSTYERIMDVPGLRFTARGAMEAKGKGRMEMYFVERA